MCELFSFSTPRDGQVDVWRSPVDQMLRLSNAVPPTTSLKQAHLIEHCLVEAHRSAVVKDGGTILGTTTAARVTVTLIFSADVDLRKYHSLLDINVTPELVEEIFPLIEAEARARDLDSADLLGPPQTQQNISNELANVLSFWKEIGAARTIRFYSAEPDRNNSHAQAGHTSFISYRHTSSQTRPTFSTSELVSYIRQRLTMTIPEGVTPRWNDPDFRDLVLTRYRYLLKSPLFFVRELEQILDREYTASAVNQAFAAFS
jgi:hypothetical protein